MNTIKDIVRDNRLKRMARLVFEEFINKYINTGKIDDYHRIHFLERACLCGLCDDRYKQIIKDTYIDVIGEILKWCNTGDYRKVIDKYIIPTYADKPTKTDQYEFFGSLEDNDTMEYLAWGVLCERLCIMYRNGVQVYSPGYHITEYMIPINKMIGFAKSDKILKKASPTYYINSIYYAAEVMRKLSGNTYDKDLKEISDAYTDMYGYGKEIYHTGNIGDLTRYIYGITHIVIQRSGFYRERVNDNKIYDILKDFTDVHPADFTPYIDIYNECNLCMKLLGGPMSPSINSKNLVEDIFNNIDFEHEHTYSLFLMEYLLLI